MQPLVVKAAPGDLDPTFNDDGLFSIRNAAGGNTARGYGTTLDKSGNILVTGLAYDTSWNSHMALLKLTQDGQLDTSFSNDGIVTHIGAAGGDGGRGLKVRRRHRARYAGNNGPGRRRLRQALGFGEDGTIARRRRPASFPPDTPARRL